MKRIMYLLIGLLLVSLVRADTNVSIAVASTEDINIWANPNTPGMTTYYLDGVNFKDTVNDLYDNDMSMKSIYYYVSTLFMKQDYKRDWFIVNPFKLDKYEYRLRWVFDNYFVPRTEVNEMMAYYENRLLDAELRIEAIEKILGDEAVLKGRLNVAKDYDFDLTYKNTTYFNVNDGFISLETIEQPEVNITEINVTETEVLEDPRIKIWQDLCDRGIKKWCVILERWGE